MNKTMLHVNNVCWIGGTMFFTHDMCKAYPEFKHYVLYHVNQEDSRVLELMMNDGITLSCIPQVTEEIVERIDPCLIFFNNTADNQVEGKWPYDWLKKWTLVAIHHNPTFPLFTADLDCFPSEEVFVKYKGILDRIKQWKIMPSCIDTSRYKNIERSIAAKDKVNIGKLSNDNSKKFPIELIDIFQEVERKSQKAKFCIVGGNKHYKEHMNRLKDVVNYEIGSLPVEILYSTFDILVYKTNVTETWGRIVTEAMASGLPVVAENKGGIKEQIDHGINGYLCDTNEQFVEYILKLINDENLRYEIGMEARKKSVSNFDIKRLKETTIDLLLDSVLGAI